MKKLMRTLVIISVLFCVFPISQVKAAPPPPDNLWISEVIDGSDLNASEGHSIARLPATNRHVVAYTGERPSLNHRILKFAMQVKKGTGNCGTPKDWLCMEVDTTPFVGWSPSIAVVQNLDNKDLIHIGISYMDKLIGSLKYAKGVYDRKTDMLTGPWVIETIDGPSPDIYRVAFVNTMTFDPKTSMPVIAYESLESDAEGNPGNKSWLNTTTYVGGNKGNCGESQNWNCAKIISDYTTRAFTHIGLGWIDDKLYYFYNSQFGLSYALATPGTTCWNMNYYCGIVDDTNIFVGTDLKVSSWRGNLPGTPSYNSLVRENGVNLVYTDETNQRVKFVTTPKTGPLFKVGTIASFGGSSVSSLSVTTDPNYFAAVTFSRPGVSNKDLVLARPAPAFGLLTGTGCGVTMGTWFCDVALAGNRYEYAGKLASIDVSEGNLVSIVHNQYYPLRDLYGLQILRQDNYKLRLPLISK